MVELKQFAINVYNLQTSTRGWIGPKEACAGLNISSQGSYNHYLMILKRMEDMNRGANELVVAFDATAMQCTISTYTKNYLGYPKGLTELYAKVKTGSQYIPSLPWLGIAP